MLKTKTPLKRRKPLKSHKGLYRGGKLRPKAKPKRRKARLAAETERRVKKLYTGLPCILCLFEGSRNTNRTCGHHIVPKSRCRAGRHDPANIIPLCPKHHTTGNDCCPHSSNPLASAHFDRWLERWMPLRWSWTNGLDKRAKQGPPFNINEVELDHTFWDAVSRNGRDYEFVCQTVNIEAYACAELVARGEGVSDD